MDNDLSSFNLFCYRISDEKEDGSAKTYGSYTPDHKNVLSRPSLMRVYQYLANSNISLTYSPGTEFVRLTGVPLDMQQILLSMGEEWCRYYISDTYRPYIASAD